MEWNFSQSITLPKLIKEVAIDINTGKSKPVDFEDLKKNREFLIYLNQLIDLRKGGINESQKALLKIERLITMIQNELDEK